MHQPDALQRMGLASQSWEYASEMVLKSVLMGLQDDRGTGHLLPGPGRAGVPPQAGGLVLALPGRLDQSADHVRLPGPVLPDSSLVWSCSSSGLLLTLPLSFGSISIGSYTFSLYWQLLGVTLAVLGLQSLFSGILAQVFVDYSGTGRATMESQVPLHPDSAHRLRPVPHRVRPARAPLPSDIWSSATSSLALRPPSTTWR